MKTILIVDDSIFTRNIHQQLIAAAGYRTVTAAGGGEAIAVYESEKPDLVTMDLLMPDMDGMEALQKIREMDPGARVVICSTDKQKYRREEATQFGAVGFLAKPVDPDELVALLADILGGPNGEQSP